MLKAPKIDTGERGRTGLTTFSGAIAEEELRQLQTPSIRRKIYKEMASNDAVIGAILFVIDMMMRQVKWWVKPASPSSEDVRYAAHIESCLHDMSISWPDILSEILSFLPWGYSVHEICYKYRQGPDGKHPSRYSDGLIGWRKLPIRGQDTIDKWEFDSEGGIAGVWQEQEIGPSKLIPIEKALLFRTNVYKNNPEGTSILRRAYRSWYLKKRIETYEAIGIERDLAGLPLLYVPAEWVDKSAPDELKAAYEEAKTLVTNIRNDEQAGMVLPSIFDEDGNQLLKFELVSSSGSRNFNTDKIIQRYDHRITMSVVADFLLLGTKGYGSFALSSDKTHIFAVAMGAWLDTIASVFNRHGIPRLMRLNGWKITELPELQHGDIESDDLEVLGNFVKNLSASGLSFTDHETQNKLRSIASLPELLEDPNLDPSMAPPPKDDSAKETVDAVRDLAEGVKKAIEADQDKNLAFWSRFAGA
jgi:hypothetical protein